MKMISRLSGVSIAIFGTLLGIILGGTGMAIYLNSQIVQQFEYPKPITLTPEFLVPIIESMKDNGIYWAFLAVGVIGFLMLIGAICTGYFSQKKAVKP